VAKTNTLGLSVAGVAAVVAALLLLVLIADTRPAQATFPGPNGSIAFESRDGSIWTMNPDGTGETELVGINDGNWETNPAVSPDGKKIVYVHGGHDIAVMNSDGTNAKELTDQLNTEAGDYLEPTWSPDGKKIAFSRAEDGPSRDYDIWVMNPDGSGQKNLTNTPNNRENEPAWSPDGLQIAYTSECDRGFGQCVYKMFANGLGQTNLTNPDDDIQCPDGSGRPIYGASEDPSWSPDGSQIAFEGPISCNDASTGQSACCGSNIWVMNSSDGSEKKDLIQDDSTMDLDPSWSPDGSKIVFTSSRSDPVFGYREIYTMDAEGEEPLSGLKRLTFRNGVDDTNPDWGPPLRAVSIPNLTFTEETRTGPPGCSYSTNPGQPLQFLSVDEHDFFDADSQPDATPNGNTRIYGTITVRGTPGDALQSLVLEIVKGQEVIRAQLAPTTRTALIRSFPSTGVLQISQRQELFRLSSAQAAQFDTTTNTVLTLRVMATTQRGGTTTKTYSYKDPKTGQATTNVQQLVLYDGNNRYPIPRTLAAQNANEGGDGWVLPSLEPAAAALGPVNPGTVWGDFSNMNGGAICPHSTHQNGYDVDGDAVGPNAWYDARNAATANNILDMLRHPIYDTRINKVFVTYNRPGGTLLRCENGNTDTNHSAFYTAIQNETVPAPGGGTRSATSVIRPVMQHCVHFHIQFSPRSTYSAVGDFSATQNPHGVWSYGYRASSGSGLTLYTKHDKPWGCGVDRWYPEGASEPMIAYNGTGQTASCLTINHPSDVLNVHPGPAGEKSVVRWRAPSSGTVKIEGRFEGIDTDTSVGGTTSDVAVVHNSATNLFSASVNGFGAKTPFSITRTVAAGDTIDFSVGYGSNATHSNDSTGLSVTITPT
jgi:Tol biopolymer transport system component